MENIEPTSLFTFESHDTALCAIPPRELWSSVDRLRCLYDKAYTAWPPHVNIIYPFVRPEVLEHASQAFRRNAIEHQPQVALDNADFFKHKHQNTIYLGQSSKENVNQLVRLKNYISNVLGQPQDSTDENFTPHMTIGQSEDAEAAPHYFLLEKARRLAPISWKVREVAILVREPLTQSGSPRPMKLWGTLNLESGTLTQTTQPQDFTDRLEETSRITFQPSHCFSESPNLLEKDASPAHATEIVLDRLVVASYNVLAEFEWPPQSHRHAPLVQNLLSAQAAADVVVLQEVTDHFLPDLLGSEELRGRYPCVSHRLPDIKGAEPLPSLLNIVVLRCTVVRFSTIGTSDAPDGQFNPWILVACHLSQGLTDGAIATKKNEIQKMLDYLSRTFPQNPWILAGDFNIVTSSHTVEAARKKQDISLQTVHRLQDIDRALLDAGFLDTWLATRLESGESSDMINERRSVLDSFQGEQGATFDPLTNTLTAELVGSGLNNRPQRYDKILVKTGHYHPHGFNMFGQTPFQSTQGDHSTYASDHWGIRCLLLKSSVREMSKAAVPEMKIKLQHPVPSLVEDEGLENFLENYGCLPTEQERENRAQAVRALEVALKDVDLPASEDDTRSGPPFVVVPVGSYGLGVWTSSSDIDCLCIGPFSSKTFFALAVQRLKRAADIRIIRRVKANSGYMLELEVHGIKVDLQYCAAASIAERWPEVMKRPANDSAFALPFQTLAKLKPVRDLFYLRRSLPDMVQYRMAHLFIKSWAQARGIYSAKFGFLGGIHISVLLVPICKALASGSETVSPTDIVVTFFRHYSNFDWKTSMVFDPFFHKDLRYNRTFREPLCLIGWHAPALNTAPIASNPTVMTIAAEIERANRLLSEDGCTWNSVLGLQSAQEAGKSRGATEFLKEFKTYIKIDAHYWGPSQEKSGRFIGWLESRCVMLLVDVNRKLQHLVARIWPSRFLDTSSGGAGGPGEEYHGCYLIGLAWDGNMSKDDVKEMRTSIQTVLQDFETRIHRDEKYYDAQSCWMSATLARGADLGDMEVDQSLWGEFAGDTDDEDSDEELEEEEELDNDEDESKGKGSTHGSRAAMVGKTPGLGKFRTAADVLNRLRWDTNFDPSDYIVGYEDRFLGARERAVEHWKSEQTDEEFIPQHRILYFKRRADNVIVWERRTRTDDIFGSGIKKQTTDV
ncbi:hypothetical protein FAUST_3647 [Fusarium austroamericanum]|uniref:polynucleotide adenylyltransferase n=1 Tax=Fusarium austroamericanum TaxID=282268 RepID=A0AAN6HHK1_FUSAU|nr:hypothetical protein FAUST_3647 [Fusarium austroamericanum]